MSNDTNQQQWVVFRAQGREYALHLQNISEVLRMVALTPVPEAPAGVLGLINLRGHLIPVFDVRTRLGLPLQAPNLSTPIMVVDVGDHQRVGLLTDEVVELLALPTALIHPPDAALGPTPLIAATLHTADRLIMVLNLECLCAGAEAVALSAG